MENSNEFKIKELDLDMIQPSTQKAFDPNQGGSKTIVIGKPGCFAKGTKVLRYDGMIANIEDIKEGDLLMGDDSSPRKVLELCRGFEKMYKVIPNKGEPVVVNENHILSLKNTDKKNILNITVKDFLRKSKTFQSRYKWYRTGVEFSEKQVDLDPYFLGIWLGDGDQNETAITTNDSEILDYLIDNFNEYDIVLKKKYTYHLSPKVNKGKINSNQILNSLKKYSLINNKHIPALYKCNSREIRLQLLAGLLDSDGYYDRNGNTFEFVQKREGLFNDFIYLARSLGFACYKTNCKKMWSYDGEIKEGEYFRCHVSGNIDEIPTKIKKKQAMKRNISKDVLVTGFKLEEQHEDDYYGFTLDGNHLFVMSDFSVVHNTGKSTLISSLLYAKKHIFPVAMAFSGSEDSNHHYRQIMPSTFVFNEYNEDKIQSFINRQKIAKQHLQNPWAILLLDDCTDDPRIFRSKLQHALYKKGRHYKCWYILSLQYAMDVQPAIRVNVDNVFILREPSIKIRKIIWENYASIVPDFATFCGIMDQITTDYTALYIHNQTQTNNWQDCIYWYKADPVPSNFKFGSKDYWDFHYSRYDGDYTDPV